MPSHLQPFLHDLVTVLAAPTQVLSRPDGQIGSAAGSVGAQGVVHADVRVLSRFEVLVDGDAGEHVATTLDADGLHVTSVLRRLRFDAATGPDPSVRLDRFRSVRPGAVEERLVLSSVLEQAVVVELRVWLAADLLGVEDLKHGATGPGVPIRVEGETASWGDGAVSAQMRATGAELAVEASGVSVRWTVRVPARGDAERALMLSIEDRGGVVVAAPQESAADDAVVERALTLAGSVLRTDRRIEPWLRRSLADLARLRMSRPESPDEMFYAAGSPWYFTLFGRDSLISARMALPLDPRPAVGTLTTLAALQGQRVDVDTAEEPGKIMHELRRPGAVFLPPLYYGTIDATALWVNLLHDVWQAGEAPEVVQRLLPNLQAALRWLTTYGDADGDGFCEYLDATGRGLANQGWKDSSDSVRFADGTIARGPVALCEVQGYAYEAAVGGAELLSAYGLPGADELRSWADQLRVRFRDRFWVTSRGRRFPALALDGDKRPVDSLTSNIGHLLGTGLLDADEERAVAELVSGPELDSGLGLRTMSNAEGGYSPLSYHCGSVWPHDTGIVIAGLVRAGLAPYASGLVEGLITAATAWDGRFPELYSGEGRPVPYPAACRPQAWSAAAVVPCLQALAALS